jgi:NAD(P)-dependent dehydrogenase (short-subunit alcohol dehydrogenase family)
MTVGVVTGAASGMGRACVDRLLGSVDVLLAVDVASVDIAGTESFTCDVRDDVAVRALVDRVSDHGRFRFLVHAAGLSPTMADPRTIVDVNLVGTARMLDAFEPLVTTGSVAIPFASSAGYLDVMLDAAQLELLHRTREPDVLDAVEELITDSGIAYLYSKVGVQLEARMAATRWAPLGGRVVSLAPGNLDTPMGRLELDHQPLMREAQAAHPLGRLGDPREIAAVVAFIVSKDASFLSGIDVLVDGAERANALGGAVSR